MAKAGNNEKREKADREVRDFIHSTAGRNLAGLAVIAFFATVGVSVVVALFQ